MPVWPTILLGIVIFLVFYAVHGYHSSACDHSHLTFSSSELLVHAYIMFQKIIMKAMSHKLPPDDNNIIVPTTSTFYWTAYPFIEDKYKIKYLYNIISCGERNKGIYKQISQECVDKCWISWCQTQPDNTRWIIMTGILLQLINKQIELYSIKWKITKNRTCKIMKLGFNLNVKLFISAV